LLHNLKHNKVLHKPKTCLSVRSHEVPWIGNDKRIEVGRWAAIAGRS
jgi:KUP system potassium uptake protein